MNLFHFYFVGQMLKSLGMIKVEGLVKVFTLKTNWEPGARMAISCAHMLQPNWQVSANQQQTVVLEQHWLSTNSMAQI